MVYVIDTHDRLSAFDSAFRSFAAAGGAAGLPDEWLGRSIWESTSSSAINMVIRSLVGRARQGQVVKVPTRCDGPHLERFVQLQIAAAPDGEVTFTSTVTRARFQAEPTATVQGTAPAQAHTPLRMCAWCFRIEDDGWHGAEHVVAERGLLLGGPLPDVSHGICPDCLVPQLDEADSSILPSPLFRTSSPV